MGRVQMVWPTSLQGGTMRQLERLAGRYSAHSVAVKFVGAEEDSRRRPAAGARVLVTGQTSRDR